MPNPGRAIAALIVSALLPIAAAAATVTGFVVDAVTRAPLQGMTVAAYDAAGTQVGLASTDANGLYQMPASGEVRLLAYDKTGTYATSFDGGAESFETTPTTLLSGNATVRADFALVKAGLVRGVVTDPGASPRSGLVVAAYNPSGTRRGFTTTNIDGGYSLALPPGNYRLAAYDVTGKWATVFYKNAAAFADATPITVLASKETLGVDFKTSLNGRINGSVVDADTQTPLAGALVYIYTQAGSLVTSVASEPTGAFHLAVPAGSYRIVAADPATMHAPSWYRDSLSFERAEIITLMAGAQRDAVRFALPRGASITGRIVDSSNSPLAGISVGAYNVDGTLQVLTTSDADGTYALFVAPGELRVGAFDPTLKYATAFYPGVVDFRGAASVSVGAGGSISSVDLQLARAGRIGGIATDVLTGQPISGIAVGVYDSALRLVARGMSGPDGRFVVAAAPGQVRVLAFDPQLRYATTYANGAPSFETTVPVTIAVDAETPLNFALRAGLRVGGSVMSGEGTPLDGIEVFALDASANRVASATSVDGAFTLVVVPGAYRFVAVDPAGRRAPRFYPDVATFAEAEAVSVGAGSAPTLSFVLKIPNRRRSIRH